MIGEKKEWKKLKKESSSHTVVMNFDPSNRRPMMMQQDSL
jgi:hypothetical protein